MEAAFRCPVCGSRALSRCLEAEAVPVLCNLLSASPEEALGAPTGDVRLALCRGCGLLANVAFEPERVRYAEGYENSLHASPRFRIWARGVARRLVESHGLRGGEVLEVGCGRGEFLALLCALGARSGVGFDPSAGEAEARAAGEGVRIVRELFSERAVSRRPDLVCCRHVLEHVADPVELLGRIALPGSVLYLEVPNAGAMLRRGGFWDVVYEHCSYFTPPALRTLLGRHGLAHAVLRTGFGGHFLSAEVRVERGGAEGDVEGGRTGGGGPERAGGVEALAALAVDFGKRRDERVAAWRDRLEEASRRGRGVAVWGAGSKGVGFLHALRDAPALRCAVDVNPRKQGRFVPVTGHRVISPAELAREDVAQVIVMNPAYLDEVRARCRELGLRLELWTA